jgi:hypothetical protein
LQFFNTILTHAQEQQDDSHAYLYILFVLMFYGFSIVVLMVKYIKREREGHREPVPSSNPTNTGLSIFMDSWAP